MDAFYGDNSSLIVCSTSSRRWSRTCAARCLGSGHKWVTFRVMILRGKQHHIERSELPAYGCSFLVPNDREPFTTSRGTGIARLGECRSACRGLCLSSFFFFSFCFFFCPLIAHANHFVHAFARTRDTRQARDSDSQQARQFGRASASGFYGREG